MNPVQINDMTFLLNDLEMLQKSQTPRRRRMQKWSMRCCEAGKLSSEVLAPARTGDEQGATFENGVVRTADGLWTPIRLSSTAAGTVSPQHRIWRTTDAIAHRHRRRKCLPRLAWSLCPLLTVGAIESIETYGSAELKKTYFRLVSGEWPGDEPDRTACRQRSCKLRCRAERERPLPIKGQKIYITYSEYDMSENIIHMVLARLPDAPAGQGISLSCT